ncbi:MFS transporter [Paenibacillus macerans]|uniref:MFS transporter n=1 Tax=Paenibacillus macerans TaxID=44252 RepID=UPI0020424DCC|nr:MFS transporter [Paenibacillus macerans]MCM3703902.1 MFS transporter [Paenibacillus macerans]
MNKLKLAIYMLTIGVFLTATSELIVSGIIGTISEDLGVSLALAGQLVTVYSLSFAIGTPVIISLTSRLSRKHMLLASLAVFISGCLAAWMSPNMAVLMISRVILGVSSGVFLVVVFGATAKIVPPDKIGSAIGTVVLGFSSAMILGIPLGMAIAEWLNWRAIFLILALLSVAVAYLIYKLAPGMEGDAAVPFFRQFKVLGSAVIVSGLLITLFRESGNNLLLTYVIPFMQNILALPVSYSSFVMLLLGIVGAIGSRLGGYCIDRWGASRVLLAGLAIHAVTISMLPLWAGRTIPGIVFLSLMVMAMFATGTAIQSYFIARAPQSSNLVLSINTSITHLGLALGAGGGGLVLESAGTLFYHPWLGGLLIGLGLVAASVSIAWGRKKSRIGLSLN